MENPELMSLECEAVTWEWREAGKCELRQIVTGHVSFAEKFDLILWTSGSIPWALGSLQGALVAQKGGAKRDLNESNCFFLLYRSDFVQLFVGGK